MIDALRLIVDPPAAGDRNMAIYEMLLERAAEQSIATLRFYQWSPATLSLGYFQNAADRARHAASSHLPLIRRSSGGGALVHDCELTYSVSLPTSHPAAADAETLYRRVHGSLLRTLADFGVAARLNEHALVALGGEPFLCFERRAVGDVLIDEHKICGSAQRRRKGGVLQHGGVLLARSASAPQLPGIADLTGRTIDAGELLRSWTEHWRREVYDLTEPAGYSADELARAETHRTTKYADDSWTKRR